MSTFLNYIVEYIEASKSQKISYSNSLSIILLKDILWQ